MINKQEVIEKIEKEKSNLNAWEDLTRNRALDDALAIIRKLDEPVKPIVPQFVAEWYEENKNDFEYSLYRLCINFHERKLYGDLYEWFRFDKNKPIETLILMHKFGYEVKKEKLYIAINKTTGEHLYFNNAKKRFESGTLLTSYAKKVKAYHHTQDKLEELNYWENPLFEIEEV